MLSHPIRVLVLCTGNSARSQMAEGLLRHNGGGRFEVHSAGVKPSAVRREAIQVMAEIGIDISAQRSKSVAEFAGKQFDYVITVCDNARDSCPIFPGSAVKIHWGLEDPAVPATSDHAQFEAFRRVRNDLRARIAAFVQTLNPGKP